MSEYILKMASIDYLTLLTSIAIIVVGSVAIKEGIERFCNMVGIEFSWIREKRDREAREKKMEEELDNLTERQWELEELHKQDIESRDEFNKTIVESIASVKDDIASLARHIDVKEAEKRFKKLRFDILNFADRISKSEQISAELIDQIFREISEYEELSNKYKFSNNRVNSSVKVIQAKYEELLLLGKIIKEDE
jgi:hypothetical protein